MPTLTIRPLQRAEMAVALDWAAAEGWNPGHHDAAPFHAADPQGFLLGLLHDEPVALISAVRYGTDSGFIGFYIVKPRWRGQGHGWALWQAALARLAGRNVGLDGVLAQQANYLKSGFKLAWRNIRYQGHGGAVDEPPALGSRERIVPLASLPFQALADYDRAFFPAERSGFLRSWIAQPQTQGLGIVRDQCLIGYGVVRPCRTGYKIGPLFAATPNGAEALFTALCAQVPADAPVFLDVPELHADAVALAERHRLRPLFETARMYTGPVPDIALPRTYGITSFELG
ncbi:MAG: GNAT family N-acetyltransferase [Sulfuricella sp.]|nr:GNAT family N-acetyltransferase [Sulfuricella sp.]